MARGVRLWLGGALACCLLAGVVYLPPRGMPKWAWSSRYNMPPENPHRLRARALAFEWQEANAALVGARFRERFAPVVDARRIGDTPGPILWLEADDSVSDWAQPVMQVALDSVWAALGIGVSKVSVGVLAAQRRLGGDRRGPAGCPGDRVRGVVSAARLHGPLHLPGCGPGSLVCDPETVRPPIRSGRLGHTRPGTMRLLRPLWRAKPASGAVAGAPPVRCGAGGRLVQGITARPDAVVEAYGFW